MTLGDCHCVPPGQEAKAEADKYVVVTERGQGLKSIPISFQRLGTPGAQREPGRKHRGREESRRAQQACETLAGSLWQHSPLPVLPKPPNFKTNCRAGFFFL